jgi:trehalose-phosphatase
MTFSQENWQKIKTAAKIWLLLDYDGTLADFAPTPDDVNPDPRLIDLLRRISDQPRLLLAIISGRRLSHIEKLIPIGGIWLAGSYGLEMSSPQGERIYRADFDLIRPILIAIKPRWTALIQGIEGFYLEDKGWSLALHARFADEQVADEMINQARGIAELAALGKGLKILGGHKFLEVAPIAADKGETVTYLLEKRDNEKVFPIFIGDDDKDERAFPVVQAYGGLAGCVCDRDRSTVADFKLASPQQTRSWLINLVQLVE